MKGLRIRIIVTNLIITVIHPKHLPSTTHDQQVGTTDANTVITALSQLDEVLQSEERCGQLAPHVDQLLIIATVQYRLVLNTKMANLNVNKEECIKIYRSLTNCLMMVCIIN